MISAVAIASHRSVWSEFSAAVFREASQRDESLTTIEARMRAVFGASFENGESTRLAMLR
jgi:hypothetical protein